MSTTGPAPARTWRYRFAGPGDAELEIAELASDGEAEAHARELSKREEAPVRVQRHDLVAWEYVTEVDERP